MTTIKLTMTGKDGVAYETTADVGDDVSTMSVPTSQFMAFQSSPGDGDGISTNNGGEYQPPSYSAVPFPGRRAITIGDSITAYNEQLVAPVSGYNTITAYGSGGYFSWLQALSSRMFDFDIALDPTFDPQCGVASTQTGQWDQPTVTFYFQPDLDQNGNPIPNTGAPTTSIGPYYKAKNNLNKFDIVFMMGGTNDISGGTPTKTALYNLQRYAYELAAAGKWVFIMPVMPRLYWGDAPDSAKPALEAKVLDLNTKLRTWLLPADPSDRPANIWMLDTFEALHDPNNTTSPIANITSPVPILHDGLHPNPAGGYLHGKEILRQLNLLGVIPARTDTSTYMGHTVSTNLHVNPTLTGTSGTLYGCTGQVANKCFVYKSTNSVAAATYSNWMAYAFGSLAQRFPGISPYLVDSTFPSTDLTCSKVAGANGNSIQRIIFNTTGGKTVQEGFTFRSFSPEFPNASNNYTITQPPYNPGDMLYSEVKVTMSNIKNLKNFRLGSYLYNTDPNDYVGTTYTQKVANLDMSSAFWPPTDLVTFWYWPNDSVTMLLRTPVMAAPTPGPSETVNYNVMELNWSFDASGPSGASCSIDITEPKLIKLTN